MEHIQNQINHNKNTQLLEIYRQVNLAILMQYRPITKQALILLKKEID